MMADMFPRERLPRAIAFVNVGFVCGTGISLIAGGAVIALLAGMPDIRLPVFGLIRNWQLVFIIVGLPGILVGLLLVGTVKEPPRRGRIAGGEKPRFVPLKDVVRFWIENWKVYAPMFLGLAVSSIENSGTQAWRPAFFERTFGWAPAQIGLYTGLVAVLMAPFGLWLGTFLAEHFIKKGQDDGNMRVVALVYTCGVPFLVLGPLMPSPWLSLAFVAVGGIVGMASAPAFNAALQLVTPNEMRGQMTALYIFVFSVIGSGFGPTFIALITDYVLRDESQIRFALAGSAAIMGPLAAFIIWRGIKSYGAAYARSKAWD
jgi:MFS family permease